MIQTNSQTNLDLVQPLPPFPKMRSDTTCKQPQPLEVIDLGTYNDVLCRPQPPKYRNVIRKKIRDPVELIDLDPDPQEIILIDDTSDDLTTASDSQGSKHSRDKRFDFVSADKRPPQVLLAKPMIKKKIISKSDPSLRIQKKPVELPDEDMFTKVMSKTNRTRYLKPSWGPCKEPTKIIALDCEMVRVEGNVQALARLTIVNYDGYVLFDKNIKPEKRVVNYMTWVSGIKPQHLVNSLPFVHYREKVFDMLKDAILVGHSLRNDCEAIGYKPEPDNLRDLAHYSVIRENNMPKALKTLASKYLNISIQKGPHDSVEDARTSMALYRKLEKQWEKDIEDAAFRKKYFS